MSTYTVRQMAAMTGKAERTIRQLAERHEEIGKRVGWMWIFSDADVRRILAIKRGGPRGRRSRKAQQAQPEASA